MRLKGYMLLTAMVQFLLVSTHLLQYGQRSLVGDIWRCWYPSQALNNWSVKSITFLQIGNSIVRLIASLWAKYMERTFKYCVLFQAFLFGTVLVWGGYQSSINEDIVKNTYATDIGNIIFMAYSVAYFINAYLLFKFNNFGKVSFLPLVALFIILGFATEIINPLQITKDLFYIIVFYLVSPILFVMQGVVLNMLFSKEIINYFNK